MFSGDNTLFMDKENRSTTLTFRLTPRQKEAIGALSDLRGLSAAQYILSLVGKDYGHINETGYPANAEGSIGSIISTENHIPPYNLPVEHDSVESVLQTHTGTEEEQAKRAMREINKKYQPNNYR